MDFAYEKKIELRNKYNTSVRGQIQLENYPYRIVT